MVQILTFIQGLAQGGFMTPEAVGVVVKKFMQIFQFGATAEFMDAMENGIPPLTENQLKEIKVAVMEVVRDLQNAEAPQAPQPYCHPPNGNIDQIQHGTACSMISSFRLFTSDFRRHVLHHPL